MDNSPTLRWKIKTWLEQILWLPEGIPFAGEVPLKGLQEPVIKWDDGPIKSDLRDLQYIYIGQIYII